MAKEKEEKEKLGEVYEPVEKEYDPIEYAPYDTV